MHGICPDRYNHRNRDLGRKQRHRRTSDWATEAVRSLTSVRPLSKSALSAGTVVIARVPFAEGAGDKLRRALVLQVDNCTITVRPISTKLNRAMSNGGATEVLLSNRKQYLYGNSFVLDRQAVVQVIPERLDEFATQFATA